MARRFGRTVPMACPDLHGDGATRLGGVTSAETAAPRSSNDHRPPMHCLPTEVLREEPMLNLIAVFLAQEPVTF